MNQLYLDLRELVEGMEQSGQQHPCWALPRLTQLVNDLGDVCGHAGPLDRGFASFLEKIKGNKYGHDVSLFRTPSELCAAVL